MRFATTENHSQDGTERNEVQCSASSGPGGSRETKPACLRRHVLSQRKRKHPAFLPAWAKFDKKQEINTPWTFYTPFPSSQDDRQLSYFPVYCVRPRLAVDQIPQLMKFQHCADDVARGPAGAAGCGERVTGKRRSYSYRRLRGVKRRGPAARGSIRSDGVTRSVAKARRKGPALTLEGFEAMAADSPPLPSLLRLSGSLS